MTNSGYEQLIDLCVIQRASQCWPKTESRSSISSGPLTCTYGPPRTSYVVSLKVRTDTFLQDHISLSTAVPLPF